VTRKIVKISGPFCGDGLGCVDAMNAPVRTAILNPAIDVLVLTLNSGFLVRRHDVG
jgi:hypothetical protein